MVYIDFVLGGVLCLGIVGIVFSLWALYDCMRDLRALYDTEEHTSAALELTTKMNFGQEILRTVLQCMFVVTAASRLSMHDHLTEDLIRPLMILSVLAAIMSSIVLLQSLWGRIGRYQLAVLLARISLIPKAETNILDAVQRGAKAAEDAFKEANNVNKKIADLSKVLVKVQADQSTENKETPTTDSGRTAESLKQIEKNTANIQQNTAQIDSTIQEVKGSMKS